MGEKLDELSGAKINVINTNLKSLQLMKQSDDISGEVEDEKNVDIIKDDIEVQTEPNTYEKFDEYIKQVELKQSDDISGEVDVESRLIYFCVKTLCL